MDGAIARAEQSVDDADLPEGLNRREYDILAFERQWWKYAGAKEEAIKELFAMSATRYYQVLNTLLDNPAALEADPMLVKRLRRMRAARQRARKLLQHLAQGSAGQGRGHHRGRNSHSQPAVGNKHFLYGSRACHHI